jgi:hypothetical protein
MASSVSIRGKTGEVCQVSGDYRFDGYLDGTDKPAPTAAEMMEPIAKPNRFPPIRSAGKGCYWKLIRSE